MAKVCQKPEQIFMEHLGSGLSEFDGSLENCFLYLGKSI